MRDTLHDEIHALWDRLADMPAAQAGEGQTFLLHRLCTLLDAQNAVYFGAVRISHGQERHPIRNWRVHCMTYLYERPDLLELAKSRLKNFERGDFDLLDVRMAAGVGTFRVHRLVDLMPPEWFDASGYRRHYRSVGYSDAMWAGIPVADGFEVYCGILRDDTRAPFTPQEADTFGLALRGLRWFHRQLMLHRGVLAAASPLTDAEQQVLGGLLSGRSEKAVSQMLGHSYHTTHAHVRAIFRKFGVKNRASLMALWLDASSHVQPHFGRLANALH